MVTVLLFTSCKKESDKPCHDTVVFYNGSADTVILGWRHSTYQDSLCRMESSAVIPPYSGWSDKVFVGCWEDQFAASSFFMPGYYFVQHGGLNNTSTYYPCDSFEYYNAILQHNVLTLSELQAMNFVVRYE